MGRIRPFTLPESPRCASAGLLGRWRSGLVAGRQIDELLDGIRDIQREITLGPAATLQDPAVKLRRLSVYLDDREPARLLEEALGVVERAAEPQP